MIDNGFIGPKNNYMQVHQVCPTCGKCPTCGSYGHNLVQPMQTDPTPNLQPYTTCKTTNTQQENNNGKKKDSTS